jgi:hypothetical protein
MRRGLLLPFSAGSVAIFSLAATIAAKAPIRVESLQVLVPTAVFDEKLCSLRDKEHRSYTLSNLIAHDTHFWDTIAIRTLPAKDLYLYEDDEEQRVLGRE